MKHKLYILDCLLALLTNSDICFRYSEYCHKKLKFSDKFRTVYFSMYNCYLKDSLVIVTQQKLFVKAFLIFFDKNIIYVLFY